MSLISSKISNEDSKNKPETETESKVETKGSKHEDRSITETSDQLAKQEQEGQGRSQNEPKQELIQSLNKYVFNTQCGNGQTFNNFPIIVRILLTINKVGKKLRILFLDVQEYQQSIIIKRRKKLIRRWSFSI